MREYPEDEPGARTVVFEGPSPGEGFQVLVPYSRSSITPERFKTDDPSGVMKDAKETVVDGTPAKSFFGHNDQMGDTNEVWFIRGGFQYEVTTYQSLDTLGAVLQSWKFISRIPFGFPNPSRARHAPHPSQLSPLRHCAP